MAAAVAVIYAYGRHLCGGVFTYALDDAYIHMAIANNVVTHGVFGTTADHFASASSSPLWTLALALVFAVTGPFDHAPLLAGVACMSGLLAVGDTLLLRARVAAPARIAVLLALIAVAPVGAVVFTGMEHAAQALADACLLGLVCAVVVRGSRPRRIELAALFSLAAVVTGVRYEGAAVVGVASAVLFLRRHRLAGVIAILGGVMPIVGFGVYSLLQGGYFLPNPILIKTADPQSIDAARSKFAAAWPILPLVALSVAALIRQMRLPLPAWRLSTVFPAAVVAVAAAHIAFGSFGWYFRYEAYLYVLLVLALGMQLSEPLLRGGGEDRVTAASRGFVLASMLVLALASAPGMLHRAWFGNTTVPLAMRNIFELPVQASEYLAAQSSFAKVAVHDLGAVTYRSAGLEVFDVVGLGQFRPTIGLVRGDGIDWEGAVRAGSQIAIIPAQWLPPDDRWVPVARWTISSRVAFIADSYTFYAIAPNDPRILHQDVMAFARDRLPASVQAESLLMPISSGERRWRLHN